MKSAHDIFILEQMAAITESAKEILASLTNDESRILRWWKEDKSILEISKLTDTPREKVISILCSHIKKEMNYE